MGLIPALISFSPGVVIRSADMNSNNVSIRDVVNQYVVFTDVARTISVAHTFTPQQIFTGGASFGNLLSFAGVDAIIQVPATKSFIVQVNSVTVVTINTAGSLVFGPAVSKILPGTTSLSLRNAADSADNLLITNAGVVTVRSQLNVTNGVLDLVGVGIASIKSTGDSGTTYIELVGATTAPVRVRFPVLVECKAADTSLAALRIPHGTAPTSPVNGDVWTTTAGLFCRINGATIGPLS